MASEEDPARRGRGVKYFQRLFAVFRQLHSRSSRKTVPFQRRNPIGAQSVRPALAIQLLRVQLPHVQLSHVQHPRVQLLPVYLHPEI